MSEENEKVKEKTELKGRLGDGGSLTSPDSMTARMAGQYEVSQAEKTRTNPSDGSLRHYQPTNQAVSKGPKDWRDQNQSIELIDGDVSVSRINPLRESNLAKGVNANGQPYQVYTAEASQAIEEPGAIDKVLTEGPYQSGVKLSVQITNVPEVSTGITPDESLEYVEHVLQAGAKAVQPIKEHLSQPNSVNQDLWNLPGNTGKVMQHLAQSPEQLNRDVAVVTGRVLETIDKPMTKDERAVAAGTIMPLFFFEGEAKPINSETVMQMKLDQMAEQDLKMLGIERKEMHMPEVPPEVSKLELQRSAPELLKKMEAKGRTFVIAMEGSEELAYMEAMHVNGIASGANKTEIWLKENPFKIAFRGGVLAGTQARHGWFEYMPEEIAEFKVKDFMLRH